MRKLTFAGLLFGLMLISGLAVAQPQGGNRGNMMERQMEWMKKELALTPEQVIKIQEMNQGFFEKVKGLREKYQSDRDAMRTEIMKLNKERDLEYQKILTEEQYQKLVKYREEMMQKRKDQQKEQKDPPKE